MLRRLETIDERLLLLLVLALAALLRFWLLGSKSLWFDEAFSALEAGRTLAEIWTPRTGYVEPHPPLYYTMLHGWVGLWGDGETAVRFPSALMSLANVALLYALGRRLAGPRVALLAGALLAVSPLNIWYAQEARMYVFVTGAGLLYALLLTWDSWWALPLLTLTLALGLYTSYLMLPLWAGLSVLWLLWWDERGRGRRSLAIWLLSSLAAGLAFLPWLPALRGVVAGFSEIHLVQTVAARAGLPGVGLGHLALLLAGTAVLALPLAWLARELLRRPRARRILAPLIVASVLLATLLMPVPRLYGLKRLLVVIWPFMLLLAAWCIMGMPRRRLVGGTTVALSLVAALVALLLVPKDDWRGALAYAGAQGTETAVITYDPVYYEIMGRYYDVAPPRADAADVAALPPGSEVWLVAARFPGQAIPSSTAEAALNARATLLEARPFYRLEARRYALPDAAD